MGLFNWGGSKPEIKDEKEAFLAIIYAAIAAGEKKFKALCVVAATAEPVAPCGACRQVMSEFGINDLFLANCDGKVMRMTLQELLPYSFSSDNLKKL